MCIQILVRFCQFALEILSGNQILTSIKGHNSVKILRKMTGAQYLEILSGNEILNSIKVRKSFKILRKQKGNNSKQDLVNVDVRTNFGQILSIRSQDIEWKQNSEVNQGQ